MERIISPEQNILTYSRQWHLLSANVSETFTFETVTTLVVPGIMCSLQNVPFFSIIRVHITHWPYWEPCFPVYITTCTCMHGSARQSGQMQGYCEECFKIKE